MIGFLVRRILQAAVVVLIVTAITVILLRAIPGNVAIAVLGPASYAPTFFVGTVLILVFSVKLGWFGPEGPQGGVLNDLTDWRDLTLPVVTLALVTIALFSRYMAQYSGD